MNKNKSGKNEEKTNYFQLRNIVIAFVLIGMVFLFFYGKKNEDNSIKAETTTTLTTEVILTDDSFDNTVLGSDKVVMVDFWATWCGPCRMMAPTIEEIAQEYKGKIVVGKLDVDQNGQTAQKYQIMSIPTIMFFKNGKVVDQVIGAAPKQMLTQKIDRLINK